MERNYRIGARTSPLALKQVEEVLSVLRGFYPEVNVEIVGIDTYGDKDKATPISGIEGSDFFTREIDEALLRDKIDFAVHSAKDLPLTLLPLPKGEREQDKEHPLPFGERVGVRGNGLVVAAITESIDPFDALVAKDNLKLCELRAGARIGTSSLRRKTQLKEYRSDFEIVDIRGNIQERLELLDNHESRNVDAIVIAAAGLIRLGLEHRITQRIPFDILKPHPLQGRLAIVARRDDEDTKGLFSRSGPWES